ncbi:MAG: hypothetical protein AB1742_01485 [bacterium]
MENTRIKYRVHRFVRFVSFATALIVILFEPLQILAHDLIMSDGDLNPGVFNIFILINTFVCALVESLVTASVLKTSKIKTIFLMIIACCVSILIPIYSEEVLGEKTSDVLLLMKPIVEWPFIYFLSSGPKHILKTCGVSLLNQIAAALTIFLLLPFTFALGEMIYLCCPFC